MSESDSTSEFDTVTSAEMPIMEQGSEVIEDNDVELVIDDNGSIVDDCSPVTIDESDDDTKEGAAKDSEGSQLFCDCTYCRTAINPYPARPQPTSPRKSTSMQDEIDSFARELNQILNESSAQRLAESAKSKLDSIAPHTSSHSVVPTSTNTISVDNYGSTYPVRAA